MSSETKTIAKKEEERKKETKQKQSITHKASQKSQFVFRAAQC